MFATQHENLSHVFIERSAGKSLIASYVCLFYGNSAQGGETRSWH